jgi:hypothetical protein
MKKDYGKFEFEYLNCVFSLFFNFTYSIIAPLKIKMYGKFELM